MSSPWLSVIIPTYNGEQWIAEALQSTRCTHDDGVELLVIDDGSTDSTLDVVSQYAPCLPLTILERPHSGNWTTSINLGHRQARGEYLCWLHQDDVWQPGRLAAIRQHQHRFPHADVLLQPSYFMDAAGRRLGLWKCPLPAEDHCLTADFVLERLLVQNFVSASAPVFRAAAAQQAGPVDEELWYVADWDYWLKLAASGRTVCSSRPGVSVRLHGQSQTVCRALEWQSLQQQYELISHRHLTPWVSQSPLRRSVSARATFSADLNLALARRLSGGEVAWWPLVRRLIGLGPYGTWRYIHDSGIIARTWNRWRVLQRADASAGSRPAGN